MFTVETVLDSLKKFDIDETQLQGWEDALGLSVPTDEYGRKQYSPHHINLFKNVKKHLALGRTLDEIRDIITLPPETASRPTAITRMPSTHGNGTSVTPTTYATKPFASIPRKPAVAAERSAQVIEVLERLMGEKDGLHHKLVETEKLNSHLYNANNLYHRKVEELTGVVNSLKEQINENRNFKLLDEKAKLHAQLLESEKNFQLLKREAEAVIQETASLKAQGHETEMILQSRINELEEKLDQATRLFDPARFCGDWEEESRLMEILYDNFGINIEPQRARIFRISEVPERSYGNTAIITTQYEYETNSLWRRIETLTVGFMADDRLEGELSSEYIIDGVPVAKALYRVHCRRVAR